jgi:TrmH family RNA methyltransferase
MSPATPVRIESLQNPLVKELRALRERRDRAESPAFIAEGVATITAALDAGWLPNLIIHDASASVRAVLDRAAATGLRDEAIVTSEILAKITGRDNPPPIIARFDEPLRPIEKLDPAAAPRWLLLEGVRDPGNLGNSLRTADAVGAGGVILVGDCCDPFAIETVRATTGSIFAVPVYRATLEAARALIARWPGASVAAMPRDGAAYDAVDYRTPALLVIGGERDGLSASLAGACSDMARIPMVGRTESLNLATAAALMLYESLRGART